MEYRILPFGNVWSNGIFNVPNEIADKYLKMASEYQLKALLFVLRNGGQSSSCDIAKALGQTASDIDDLLEFWVDEGILSADGRAVEVIPVKEDAKAQKNDTPITKKEVLPPPRLSPKDVVSIMREDEKIRFLLTESQTVLGRTISHAEQEMMINMVNYYGLAVEVVLMILEFYRAQKQKGQAISIAYINSMARDWSEEGIKTISDAEEKLKAIEKSDRLWNEVVAVTGIKHRRPTVKQREMVNEWFADFDITMITLACDIMKENISEPKLKYMDTILKKWKKNGVTSPAQVAQMQEEFEKKKAEKKDGRLQSKPSYDLEKIKRDAMNNTDI